MTGKPPRTIDLHVHTAFSSFRHLKSLRARDSALSTHQEETPERQLARLLLSDGR